VFDKDIPELPVPGSQTFIPGIYEVHGRMVFARVRVNL
jgi:hypothetical protein